MSTLVFQDLGLRLTDNTARNNKRLVAATAILLTSVTLLKVELPFGISLADLLLAPAAAYGFISSAVMSARAQNLIRVMSFFGFLVLVGSLLALWDDGFQPWAATTLIQDFYLFGITVGFLRLGQRYHIGRREIANGSLIAMVITVAILVSTSNGYRSSGFFGNPNLAAHFVVVNGVIVLGSQRRKGLRLIGFLLVLAGIALTGSFAALAGLTVALGYRAASDLMRRFDPIGVLGLFLLGIGLLIASVQLGVIHPALPGADVSTSLNTARLERSSGLREQIWKAGYDAWVKDPFGIGPHGYYAKKIFIVTTSESISPTEIHSDYLGYLVERGPIGLFGLLGFGVAIWKQTNRSDVTRILLICLAVNGVARETLHFRHLWLALSLGFCADMANERGVPG
jgi:O-Antigen ligase